MKYIISALLLSMLSNAWAVKLSDYQPYVFESLFTNPVCEEYFYDRPTVTHSGMTVSSKPKNVYCRPSDEEASVIRKNSPQYRLIEWISDKNTKELYFAYLSFRSPNMVTALCNAVKNGVKLTIVLDGGTGPEVAINKDAEDLKKCGPNGLVSVTYRGSTGGLGYAHNKLLMVNPTEKVVKIVFSSGNMTTGTSINHENWNFVTTSGDSYFAQAHKCVVEGMIEAGDKRSAFAAHLNACRSKIKARPESDIRTTYSPHS